MSLLHKESYECVVSDLDLTALPPTQTSVEEANIISLNPISSITHGGPLEFLSIGSASHYRDPADMFLALKCRVKKNNKEDLDNTCRVAIINYLINTLFAQVDVFLSGKKITPSVATHAWRSIFEVLLNYGPDAKSTHLETSGFYKDTAGKMDNIDDTNLGFVARRIEDSKPFELYGKLHTDISFQNRYIINNVDMVVRLIRNSHSFCLISDKLNNYELFIDSATLYLRQVKISAPMMLQHAMALEKATIKYPLTRVETVQYTINQGLLIHSIDNVSSGVIPKRIVFGMVDSIASQGAYEKNPFNFKHFDIAQIQVTVDNSDVPFSPLDLNFDECSWLRAYYNMFSGLDRAGLDWGNDITKKDFKEGYGLYVFDLTPDKCYGEHFNVMKKGNLKLKFSFRKPTPSVISLFIYMEYDNVMEITKARNVIFDYTV